MEPNNIHPMLVHRSSSDLDSNQLGAPYARLIDAWMDDGLCNRAVHHNALLTVRIRRNLSPNGSLVHEC